jgi:hypothetical protein
MSQDNRNGNKQADSNKIICKNCQAEFGIFWSETCPECGTQNGPLRLWQQLGNPDPKEKTRLKPITLDLLLQRRSTTVLLISLAQSKTTMSITDWSAVCDNVEARGQDYNKALADFMREFNPVTALKKAGLL